METTTNSTKLEKGNLPNQQHTSISVVSVNYNSYDFQDLLIKSIDKYSSCKHEIFIFNNSCNAVRFANKKPRHRELSCFGKNMGHGFGLNVGVNEVKGEYVLFLDIDCHILIEDWEHMFLSKEVDVVAAPGPPEKPIRPACMFMKTEIAKRYDYSSTPGYKGHRITPAGYDVAVRAYYQMVKDGLTFEWMESFPNRYGTATGEEWGLDGVPICYHHWHGTHIHEPSRQKDFPDINLFEEKEKLFREVGYILR